MRKHLKAIVWGVVLFVAVVACGTALWLYYHNPSKTGPMITQYTDEGGVVYDCSTPLKSTYYEEHGWTIGSEYRPTDRKEAEKYCTAVGIE